MPAMKPPFSSFWDVAHEKHQWLLKWLDALAALDH
jgi:hypothetical protein